MSERIDLCLLGTIVGYPFGFILYKAGRRLEVSKSSSISAPWITTIFGSLYTLDTTWHKICESLFEGGRETNEPWTASGPWHNFPRREWNDDRSQQGGPINHQASLRRGSIERLCGLYLEGKFVRIEDWSEEETGFTSDIKVSSTFDNPTDLFIFVHMLSATTGMVRFHAYRFNSIMRRERTWKIPSTSSRITLLVLLEKRRWCRGGCISSPSRYVISFKSGIEVRRWVTRW